MASKSLLRTAATMAAVTKYSSQGSAFELVRRMIKNAEHNGSLIDHAADLMILYSHLAPDTPEKPMTVFQWLSLAAAGKDDPRRYLRFVKVEEGTAVASDGQRLHMARKAGWEDGVYNPNTGDKANDLDGYYPRFKQCIPRAFESWVDCSQWQEWPKATLPGGGIILEAAPGRWVKWNHMRDALSGFLEPMLCYASVNGVTAVVESGQQVWTARKAAIILPIINQEDAVKV